MTLEKEALNLHKRLKGKLDVKPKIKLNKKNLSLLYTPGVAAAVEAIKQSKASAYQYTGKGDSIAIVSDGSRVLGLGNVGALAALPVMESKALLYKVYGNVNAIPLCVRTQDAKEIIKLVEDISPNFGAINIEDIETPKCFEIVDALSNKLDIPVFHDDQHGTAVVVLAALLNALKLVNKKIETARIIILGAGAAGYGIAKLLAYAGAKNILVLDSLGTIYKGRTNLNPYKEHLAEITNSEIVRLNLDSAMESCDVFIGVSGKKNILIASMIKKMSRKPIVFALSNPYPEILPKEALDAGAFIVATGRSDFFNQVNNALVFPFFMRNILDEKINTISERLLYNAAIELSRKVKKASPRKIICSLQELARGRQT